jgi:hypothetical protein
MSNTKQPPVELVEKMNKAFESIDPYFIDDNIEQCAQVAVDYAEEENWELRKMLTECIDGMSRMNPDPNSIIGLIVSKAKQLLNKNEDGKEQQDNT